MSDRSHESGSVAIPGTPASLIPVVKPHTWNRDDGGPYKAEMISRMETMKRGERVIPPCDRCRRLHMDCIKNLTACLGCTKKHAKCSWKDVSLDELESTAAAPEDQDKQEAAQAPTSTEWDNMLKQNKSGPADNHRKSPPSVVSGPRDVEMTSEKSGTPRASPPHTAPRPSSQPQESPRFNVRPPPLDQQLRDAAGADHSRQTSQSSRYSPFAKPAQTKAKEEIPDEGDRLAAVAAQVYRSASQNAARTSESAEQSA